jgi:hypothetical protein
VAINGSSPEQVKQEIQHERERLARAVEELRSELREATDVVSRLKARLPLLAAGALGAVLGLAGAPLPH